MEVLDPPAVRRWARLAADALGRARADIDALNVFPVADGDTGTNLYLTMLSAAEAVEALPDDVDAAVVWQTLSYGALVGARGNSGVIVSQALRGLAEVLKDGADLRPAWPGPPPWPAARGQAGRGHRAERPGGRRPGRPKWRRGLGRRGAARGRGGPRGAAAHAPGSSTCWPAAASWTPAAPGWRSCWSRWPR